MLDTTQAAETIVAISTPPGRGGIGIVRLAGSQASTICAQLVQLRAPLEHARARLADVIEPEAVRDGAADAFARIDEALVTCFFAPNSYTGEDVVEIAAHGSPLVLELLVRGAIACGARLAHPGEFTQRAFLAGRIDLTQAEAVHDLIRAQTLAQVRQAASQMGGALSKRVLPIKQQLVEMVAKMEAGIDFAEDDLDVTPNADLLIDAQEVASALHSVEATFHHGRLLHDGLMLAIVGQPNVGKSSLFNALLQRERAIVTAVPGTTRDTVAERMEIGGIPLELVDTAGLRETTDEVERLGIERSQQTLAEADIVLLVQDASVPSEVSDTRLIESLAGRAVIEVINKIDLNMALKRADGDLRVRTSARTGQGIDALRQTILKVATGGVEPEPGMLTTLRHHQSITTALEALQEATAALRANLPHEMALLDLYRALWALDSLTGQTTSDDILNYIFSTFCIGK